MEAFTHTLIRYHKLLNAIPLLDAHLGKLTGPEVARRKDVPTPIEDASVDWPSPYATVATLTLPQQDTASADGQALLKQVDESVFDPWQALAAHRPLGDVQRARKVVYFVSQKGRSAG